MSDNNFSMLSLLSMEDINIRRIADNNESLLTENYFSLLSSFLNQAPNVINILNKISLSEFTEDSIQHLEQIKVLIESIGCIKFSSYLDDIVAAIKKGDKTFASSMAKIINDDFYSFYTRILLSKRNEVSDLIHDASGHDLQDKENKIGLYNAHSLKKIIKLTEHEEATRKLRILAVDDSVIMLKNIASVLSDKYKIYTLSNPSMVESFLKQITPELFILDCKMPGLNGFDLVAIIKKFKEHQKTPIIFLTALGTIDNISTAVSLGACDFIVKPFQGQILREKVAKYIVRKKLF